RSSSREEASPSSSARKRRKTKRTSSTFPSGEYLLTLLDGWRLALDSARTRGRYRSGDAHSCALIDAGAYRPPNARRHSRPLASCNASLITDHMISITYLSDRTTHAPAAIDWRARTSALQYKL